MNILQTLFGPKSSGNTRHGRSAPVLLCILLVLLAACFVLSLCVGSVRVDLLDLFRGDVSSPSVRILIHLRFPRACGAILAGAALAVAGVLIQAVLHNPMAAPNIIGVNAGAGLGAVLMLSVFPTAVSFLPFAAFLGAIAACLCIYLISTRTGADRMTVTLVGIAVTSLLNGGINTVKTLFPDSVYDANSFMIGGLSGVTFPRLLPASVLIFAGLTVSFFVFRAADLLSLGDDGARTLGLNVKAVQLLLLALASVLAGAAVSFAGLLGFVGLVVPHMARRLVGQSHRWLIPISALGGAVLVLICDLLSRVLFAPYELPVGILLSFVGAPFFMGLILMRRKRYD